MKSNFLVLGLVLGGLSLNAQARDDADRLAERAGNATRVFSEMMASRDISLRALQQASCIAVIPELEEAGFIVGGGHGKGLVSCRTSNGWSAPGFAEVSTGSLGFVIGARETDLVLLFIGANAKSTLEDGGKFTLGGQVSMTVGPVTGVADGSDDFTGQSIVASYARSRGVMANVSFNGSKFDHMDDDNKTVYGRSVAVRSLLNSSGPVPSEVANFVNVLSQY